MCSDTSNELKITRTITTVYKFKNKSNATKPINSFIVIGTAIIIMGSCMSNVFKITRPQLPILCTSSCCSGSIVNLESTEPDGEEKKRIEQRGGRDRKPTT